MDRLEKLGRESRFWDGKQSGSVERDAALYRVAAGDLTDHSVPWLPYLGFPQYMRCLLDHLGDVRGKRVLDIGTGTGFVACLLAAQGAEVDAVDVSEASLDVARWRASISGLDDRIRFHAAPAETLPFEDARFDAICGAFVLHHLELPVAARELRRVLRPEGRAAFLETSGNSGLLMSARRMLPGRLGIEKASSDDEAPLGDAAQRTLVEVFGDGVRFHYPSTLLFRMLSYIPPMHVPPMQRLLLALDRAVHRVPALRSQSYYAVVTC